MTVTIDIDDATVVKAANEALTRPSDFGYFGDLDLFGSWGFTIATHPDSDALGQSNYRSMRRDLIAYLESLGLDPDEWVQEIHCGHWAVGWIDHLAVRILVDPDADIEPSNISHAFRWITDAMQYLQDNYPVWDESDFSELESEEHYATWTNCVWPDFYRANLEYDRCECDAPCDCAERPDPLDSIDEDELYSEVANYACEYDPDTWTDEDIWQGIVRLAERDAYEH